VGQSLVGPYFGAAFTIKKNGYAFGQAASWSRSGKVLSGQLDRAGISQIYRSNLNGSDQLCLTCKSVEGPSAFPQERPQGDWIMFDSYGQQPVHTGNPGFGGYGSDLYVMREDGSHPYRLTTNSDPNDGLPYTSSSGVPYDNFHAYWSPNGDQIAWTHTEANPLSDGGQAWEMMVGDFAVEGGVPSLQNVRVVGKPYGVYETQPWAPDGSGFLFSAAGGLRWPFQSTDPGWGHMELYFMRLYGQGASLSRPKVTQISDDTPAYNEQAIFTPDMKTVIMMSNRSKPQTSWYDLIVSAAMRTGFDALDTGSTQTLQFLSDFIGPDFGSDLFAVDVRTKAIRQLTNFPNGVVPEFYWNHDYSKIIVGVGTKGANEATIPTWIGQFGGIATSDRQVPKQIPAPGLVGEPVDMARVGLQAQSVRDPGPTDNVSVRVPPPSVGDATGPHATASSDKSTVPSVTDTYAAAWLNDLALLSQASGQSFSAPPLLAAAAQFGG
jgi:Tol biopolymer transport system component